MLPFGIIEANRSDRRRYAQTDTGRVVNPLAFMIPGNLIGSAPSCTQIAEHDPLYFLGNGEPVLDSSLIHLIASELVVFITAEIVRSAESKEIIVRHVTCRDTAHKANGNDVFDTDFIVKAVFNDKFVVIEVAAQTVTGPNARKGKALASCRIVCETCFDEKKDMQKF